MTSITPPMTLPPQPIGVDNPVVNPVVDPVAEAQAVLLSPTSSLEDVFLAEETLRQARERPTPEPVVEAITTTLESGALVSQASAAVEHPTIAGVVTALVESAAACDAVAATQGADSIRWSRAASLNRALAAQLTMLDTGVTL